MKPTHKKAALAHLKSADPKMAALIERVGPYQMTYRDPDFWALTRSIAGQQLHVKAASTIFGRFEAACGEKGITPERVLALRETTLRKAGLSAQKSSYIRDLARHVRDGHILFDELHAMDDAQVIERLTKVKGIGTWTVEMFLMFALRRVDVLPVGDYGIRAAMQRVYELPEMPKPAQMHEIAEAWKPWRTVACWYLWRSLDGGAAL
jgi:DNA-3-methyladenine glycosylase II